MSFEIRSMAVSEILDTGFQLVRSRLRDLAGIGFIVYLPFALLSLALSALVGPEGERLAATDPEALANVMPAAILIGSVSLLAFAFGYPLIVAAVTLLVGGVYLGREMTIGQALRGGLERFLPLLGTFLLFGLLVMTVGGSLGALFAGLFAWSSNALGGLAAGAVALFGGVAMVVFYVYLSAAYAVMLQVVIFERLSGFRAIARATTLTDGMRLRTVTVIFVATFAVVFVGVVVEIFFGSVPYFGVLAGSAVQALGFAYTSCTEVVIYFDLRCRKEAFDLEYLAQLVEADEARGALGVSAG